MSGKKLLPYNVELDIREDEFEVFTYQSSVDCIDQNSVSEHCLVSFPRYHIHRLGVTSPSIVSSDQRLRYGSLDEVALYTIRRI